jgi:hypothetical protein
MRASRKAEAVSGFHYETRTLFPLTYKAKKIEIYEPTDAELKELKASVAGLKERWWPIWKRMDSPVRRPWPGWKNSFKSTERWGISRS